MKPSAIYRKAAGLVGETMPSCCAISAAKIGVKAYNDGATQHWKCIERTDYANLFCPALPPMGIWGDDEEWNDDHRILALLLMSEISKDSERRTK